jgi:hypothetical protein
VLALSASNSVSTARGDRLDAVRAVRSCVAVARRWRCRTP